MEESPCQASEKAHRQPRTDARPPDRAIHSCVREPERQDKIDYNTRPPHIPLWASFRIGPAPAAVIEREHQLKASCALPIAAGSCRASRRPTPRLSCALMSAPGAALDESLLASRLCTQLLGVAELKALCVARGFSPPGGSKEALAAFVAARLLEPRGAAEAMARLEGPWLAALHFIAAANAPVALGALAPVLEPDKEFYLIDHRTLWGRVSEHLVSRGVLLADDAGHETKGRSRFARMRLMLPVDFRRLLPPAPVNSEPVSGAGESGDLGQTLRRALAAFVEAGPKPRRVAPKNLVGRLSARLSLSDERLALRDGVSPSAKSLARLAETCWEAGLSLRDDDAAPVTAGHLARHLLGHLPSGRGCTADALSQALRALGAEVKAMDVAAFLDEGLATGALTRHPRPRAEPLFAAAPPVAPTSGGALALTTAGGTVTVDLERSALMAVLEVAPGARATIAGGALRLEPDPVGLGRHWSELAGSASLATLRAASPAFDAAARLVEERRGQVQVHKNLTLLRIEDVGLHALLLAKFPGQVRELSGRHLAVPSGKAAELVALAAKQGFVARRLP